jgi:hypothetical protein
MGKCSSQAESDRICIKEKILGCRPARPFVLFECWDSKKISQTRVKKNFFLLKQALGG